MANKRSTQSDRSPDQFTAPRRLIERLGSFNRAVGKAGVLVAASFVAVMTVSVMLGVFFRYVLNDSLTWVEDVSLILMVTTAFLVAAFAYRTGANVSIELLVQYLPEKLMRGLRILVNVLVLWILYRYLFESIALIERGWSIKVNTLPFAWAWCYMILPLCFGAMILVAIELLMRDCYALVSGDSSIDLTDPDNDAPASEPQS